MAPPCDWACVLGQLELSELDTVTNTELMLLAMWPGFHQSCQFVIQKSQFHHSYNLLCYPRRGPGSEGWVKWALSELRYQRTAALERSHFLSGFSGGFCEQCLENHRSVNVKRSKCSSGNDPPSAQLSQLSPEGGAIPVTHL